MENKRIYTIQINGIKESIDAVDALNKQLNALESRIKALESANVKVASTPTAGASSTSNLSQEVAIEKELNSLKNEGTKLEAKQVAYQDESYQKVLAQKDILKEIVNDQKAVAAQERLQADTYSNTMQGMKQKLADLKSVINTTDLGDGDSIKKMTQEANELNSKLLELEKSYGQFGRQVGHYEIVNDGLGKIVIAVGGIEREFTNAREASRELSNELKTMAINGEQGTEKFNELQKAVARLNSDIKDATVSSKAMDNMLDTMQSIVAIGNVSQSFSTLFGFDDDELNKSIQKLVALQNALKGIESINQQIKSGEFMGGWLSKGNEAVDKLAASLLGANKAQQTLNSTTTAGATASKSLAVAETAQAAATNTATVATKALSLALKTIGIGLIISAVAMLITYWKDIYKWFTDTVPALKKLETWFDKIRAVAVGVGTALANHIIQPLATLGKTIKAIMEGNFKEIPNIIAEGFVKTFNVVGNFQKGYNKEIERQQEVHNDKMREQQKKANEEAEKDAEAKYGKDLKRTREHLNKQLALTKEGTEEYKELQRQIWENERQEREESNKKTLADQKKYSKEMAEEEKELSKLRIENMKEGLRKTITQLEEERKARLAKLNSNSKNYKELEAQINALYDKKIEEATKEHTRNVEKMYDDMWKNIRSRQIDNYEKALSLQKSYQFEYENKNLRNAENTLFNQNISSYGIQGKKQYSPSTQESLGIISTVKNDETVNDYKKLIDIMREYSLAENAMKNITLRNNNELEAARQNLFKVEEETNKKLEKLEAQYEKEYYATKMALDAKKKLYDDYYAELAQKYDTQEKQAQANAVFNALIEESYSKDLSTMFNQRMQAVETYWKARINDEKQYAEDQYKTELEIAKLKHKDAEKEEEKSWNEQVELQNDWFEKKREELKIQAKKEKWSKKELDLELLNIDKEYDKAARELLETHGRNLGIIDKEYEQKKITLEIEKNDKLKKNNAEYYQDALQEFRDFQTALSNLASKQPVMNAFGIVNLKQTNKNNKELLDGYENLARQISQKREQLTNKFKGGLIDKDVYQSSLREMDSFVADLGEKMDKVKYELSFGGQWEMLAQGINQWVQMVGQGISQIMSSLSQITQNQYEAQISEQEKYIEEYEKLLDKQEEITRDHADKVNDIEDELKTARGDRRQQLIDNLNAEMAAQRASLAQEKKIEKEKEKAEEKKKKLEHDQAVAKKKMDLAQAYINAAMAVSMAAVNHWPVPAIPMMALAAAAGAAQIAAIQSQNIPSYGSGGLLEGKSHRDGGIKTSIGSSPIELEGHEYVIRKKTTEKNVQLLDYINKSERKLNINDFIDFYSSGNVKKNIVSANPKTRFENGGQIPILRNDIDMNNRLIDAMTAYANRPMYVAVTEIEDKMADVNYIRTVAGVNNN